MFLARENYVCRGRGREGEEGDIDCARAVEVTWHWEADHISTLRIQPIMPPKRRAKNLSPIERTNLFIRYQAIKLSHPSNERSNAIKNLCDEFGVGRNYAAALARQVAKTFSLGQLVSFKDKPRSGRPRKVKAGEIVTKWMLRLASSERLQKVWLITQVSWARHWSLWEGRGRKGKWEGKGRKDHGGGREGREGREGKIGEWLLLTLLNDPQRDWQ